MRGIVAVNKKRAVFLLLFIFSLSALTMGSFYVGGEFACRDGYKQGFACVRPHALGVCVYNDMLVPVDPEKGVFGSDLIIPVPNFTVVG